MKCDELKVHKAYNRWIDEEMPTPNDDLICNEVYLKSEADKELRHQKHKRCLAMAKWCDTKADWYYGIGMSFRDRVEFYIKWLKRWLKIAEQFKEGV